LDRDDVDVTRYPFIGNTDCHSKHTVICLDGHFLATRVHLPRRAMDHLLCLDTLIADSCSPIARGAMKFSGKLPTLRL
jgi:hypothetical protein